MNTHSDPLESIREFLNNLENFAPTSSSTSTRVEYRSTLGEEIVEDSMPSEQSTDAEEEPEPISDIEEARRASPVDEADAEETEQDMSEAAPVHEFQEYPSSPVAAVDCGIVRLGETENGLIIALRSTVVVDQDSGSSMSLFRSGPVYLHNRFKRQLLHMMGTQLGKPDLFVEVDETDPENPQPTRVKGGVADNAHQYGDRFRNWFERIVQQIAVTSVENGVILFDGALTLRTRDTPASYLERLARSAGERGNAIVAISKQSMLQVEGRSVRFWLDDYSNTACYRLLSTLMRREGAERVLGNAYAIRFSVLGPTFRMDVKPAPGQTDHEAIGQLYSSALMRGGYPDILVRAHTHSYFTSPDEI